MDRVCLSSTALGVSETLPGDIFQQDGLSPTVTKVVFSEIQKFPGVQLA